MACGIFRLVARMRLPAVLCFSAGRGGESGVPDHSRSRVLSFSHSQREKEVRIQAKPSQEPMSAVIVCATLRSTPSPFIFSTPQHLFSSPGRTNFEGLVSVAIIWLLVYLVL